MLINLRNALMAGRRLPYDAEVEYLESTGTQWIDTGVVATNNTRVKIAFSDYTRAGAWLFGARRAYKDSALGVYTIPSGNNVWFRAFGDFVSRDFTFSTVDLGVSTFDYDCGHFTGTREKVPITVDATDTASAFTSSPYNIYLWTVNLAGTPGAVSSAKMYATQIWQNGFLVRDFIPVRCGTTGYLYDRVSKRLFGNAGTGNFVLGPDVVPVEYIESHGTEYIDTGTVPTVDTNIHLTYATLINSGSDTNAFFGSRIAAYNSAFSVLQYNYDNGLGLRWDYGNGINKFAHNVGLAGVHTLSTSGNSATLDGVTTVSGGGFSPSGKSIWIFAINNNGAALAPHEGLRAYAFQIYDGSLPVRSFCPVRVGSGSTWEGAMMDVLTRKIYRNQGTGAFTYGGDLKYPIPVE